MLNRYARQQQVPQLGAASQQQLAQARVLVIGVGGLGSPVCQLLTGAGVGHLTLVDFDVVDVSNLHRQTLFCEADIGQLKVEAALPKLRSINSDVTVQGVSEALTPDNVDRLVSEHTLVVDTADSFFVSYLLSDVCLRHKTPLVSASVLQTSGYIGVFCGSESHPAPSLRAIFPTPPWQMANCSTAGVTGPSVGVIGAIQAQEVLKVIVSDPAQLLGHVLHMELWDYQQHRVDFREAPEPNVYAQLVSLVSLAKEEGKGACVLDVRSVQETQQKSRPEATLNIPIDELLDRHTELDKRQPTVCVCQSGQRALSAADQLLRLGFEDVSVAL